MRRCITSTPVILQWRIASTASPPACVVSTMRKWHSLSGVGAFEEPSDGCGALEAAAPGRSADGCRPAAIYRDQCSACHGSNGHGTAQLLPFLANSAHPPAECTDTYSHRAPRCL